MQPTASPFRVSCRKISSFRPRDPFGRSDATFSPCQYEGRVHSVNALSPDPAKCENVAGRRRAMVSMNVQNPALPAATAPSPFYTEEHEAFRSTVRRFVERELMPYVDQWDEAEEFPRELYRKASAAGLL